MVLQINNSKIDTEITIDKFYSEFPDFVNTGSKFASTPCRSINGGSEGVLYIRQKEDIVTFHGDQFDDGNVVKKVGTQDVLTCHVVTLRHEVSDGFFRENFVKTKSYFIFLYCVQ